MVGFYPHGWGIRTTRRWHSMFDAACRAFQVQLSRSAYEKTPADKGQVWYKTKAVRRKRKTESFRRSRQSTAVYYLGDLPQKKLHLLWVALSSLHTLGVPNVWVRVAKLLANNSFAKDVNEMEKPRENLPIFKNVKMSAKHQENDTPVKASHLLLVIAVCPVLVPEHCLLGEPPKHEKFVSFHKSSVEW